MFRYVPRLLADTWVVLDRETRRTLPCEDRPTAEGIAAGLNLIHAIDGMEGAYRTPRVRESPDAEFS